MMYECQSVFMAKIKDQRLDYNKVTLHTLTRHSQQTSEK